MVRVNAASQLDQLESVYGGAGMQLQHWYHETDFATFP